MTTFCHWPLLRLGSGRSMTLHSYFQYVEVYRGSFIVGLLFLCFFTSVGESHYNIIFKQNCLLQLLLKVKADKYVLNVKDIDVKWVNDLSESSLTLFHVTGMSYLLQSTLHWHTACDNLKRKSLWQCVLIIHLQL